MWILWKGAAMNTSLARKALSVFCAFLLCFSLAPAPLAGAADAGDEAVRSASGAESVPSDESITDEAASDLIGITDATEATPEEGADAAALDEETAAVEGAADAPDSDGLPADSGKGDPTTGTAAPLAEGVYLIRSLTAYDEVLDVEGASPSDGANVRLYASNMSSAQQFRVEFDEVGFCTLTNVASGKVLDVEGGVAESGTNVQQYEANGSAAQKWILVPQTDGSFVIQSALSGELALDVEGGVGADGANVQIYASNGTEAQRFAFLELEPDVPVSEAVEPGVYLLESALGPSLSAGIAGQSHESGAGICLMGSEGALSRLFMVSVDDEGYATLRCANSGLALDVEGGNLVPTTRVQQWQASEGNRSQQWSVRTNEDGTISLLSRANGLALDVQGAVAAAGAKVQTFTDNGTLAQKWHLVVVDRIMEAGLYTLTSSLDAAKAVDVKDASTADGTSLQIWARNNTPAQKFLVSWVAYDKPTVDDPDAGAGADGPDGADGESLPENADETSWAISLRPMTATGQYLTAGEDRIVSLEQPMASEGGGIDLRQLWTPSIAATGGISLQNVATGCMLDVSGAGTYDGCPVGAYEPNGTAAQAFFFDAVKPVDNGTYLVQSLADGRVLDVDGASRSNGANVQVWSSNGSGAQAWCFEDVGNGLYKIYNARSKKALDVTGGEAVAGANVQQYAWNGSNAQLWRAAANADGSYTFVSACGGLVLDVAGAGGYDGANVQIYDSNGSAAQKFRLIPTDYVPKDFEDLIATFTTYSSNTWNGTYNMQKALDCFDGIVLQPGQSMSFYGVTGRCGAAEGYLPAGVVGGIGYGGGICQASTTIYGAAIRAGFGIVDRQNHSVPSVYVPIGLDAMVSWGTSDLVVRNDTGYPAKIVTYTYDNVLTCEIWGTQADWYDYIEPVSWYTSSNSANAQRVYYKDGAAIYTEWLPSSYYW